MTPFDAALALVLQEEGGKVDNPRDPGGRTNLGITQATYDAWRRANKLLKRDVYTITREEAADIYRNRYADPIRFDEMPLGVGYCVLDCAVLEGLSRAIRDLQTAVGTSPDGRVGQITLGRVWGFTDKLVLIDRLCDARLTFLRRLKTFVTFGRGWSNRVEFVRVNAKRMAG